MQKLEGYPRLHNRVFVVSLGDQWPVTASVPLMQTVLQYASDHDGTHQVLRDYTIEYMYHECAGAAVQNLVSGREDWSDSLQFHHY
jgi:hypothetical protein